MTDEQKIVPDVWHAYPDTLPVVVGKYGPYTTLPTREERHLLFLLLDDGTVVQWGPFNGVVHRATHWMLRRSGWYEI